MLNAWTADDDAALAPNPTARLPYRAHLWSMRDHDVGVRRSGHLTSHTVEGLIKDALRLGRHARIDLILGTEPDDASLDWLQEQVARLDARGVKLRLRVAPFRPERARAHRRARGLSIAPTAPEATPDLAPPVPAAAIAIPPHRVLLAEDDEDQRHFLAHALRVGALDVVEASDGISLLAALQAGNWTTPERAFDVVVTDLDLPDMSGLEVLRAVRGLARHVPSIVVTAYDSAAVREEARAVGVDTVLAKPLDPAELRATVCSLIAAP